MHTNIFVEKLAKEEVLLREGEGRLQALQKANGMDCQEVPPTIPVQFCTRIGSVESMCARVADRTGRPPRQVTEFGRSRRQGAETAQNSASPALNLFPLNRNTIDRTVVMGGQVPCGGPSSASVRMETLIENVDSSLRSGRHFNLLSS